MRTSRIVFVVIMVVFSSQLLAEQGVIVRSAILRESTSYVAKRVANLTPGTEVKLLERKGGWQKVLVLKNVTPKHSAKEKRSQMQGWIRGYQVRVNLVKQSDGAVEISQNEGGVLTGLSRLSRSTSNIFGRNKKPEHQNTVVATIGVRGLSEQDLANAKPNLVELDLLKQYASNDKEAKAFAKQERLKKHKVAELDDPKDKKKNKRKSKKKDKG